MRVPSMFLMMMEDVHKGWTNPTSKHKNPSLFFLCVEGTVHTFFLDNGELEENVLCGLLK